MDSVGKMLVRWKDRAMPRWAILCGGVPAMSRPSNTMRPAVGAICPLSRLKKVVLPAPLGPITECRAPSSTSRVTALTAVSAPNSLVSPSVLTRGIGLHGGGPAGRTPRPEARPRLDNSATEEQHHDDEGHTEEERPTAPPRAHRLGEPDEHEGADARAVERSGAADEGGEDDIAREDEADGLERHDAEEHRVEHSRETGDGDTDDEGRTLQARHVEAQGLGARLFLPDRPQDLPERRLHEPLH